jgi:hypothetical protein
MRTKRLSAISKSNAGKLGPRAWIATGWWCWRLGATSDGARLRCWRSQRGDSGRMKCVQERSAFPTTKLRVSLRLRLRLRLRQWPDESGNYTILVTVRRSHTSGWNEWNTDEICEWKEIFETSNEMLLYGWNYPLFGVVLSHGPSFTFCGGERKCGVERLVDETR